MDNPRIEWEILDMRLRTSRGCYNISMCHTPQGSLYLARFYADPRPDSAHSTGFPDYGWTRSSGIGSSYDLEKVKYMCECDYARNNPQAASHISSPLA